MLLPWSASGCRRDRLVGGPGWTWRLLGRRSAEEVRLGLGLGQRLGLRRRGLGESLLRGWQLLVLLLLLLLVVVLHLLLLRLILSLLLLQGVVVLSPVGVIGARGGRLLILFAEVGSLTLFVGCLLHLRILKRALAASEEGGEPFDRRRGDPDGEALHRHNNEVVPLLGVVDGSGPPVPAKEDVGVDKAELLHLDRYPRLARLDLFDGCVVLGLGTVHVNLEGRGNDASNDDVLGLPLPLGLWGVCCLVVVLDHVLALPDNRPYVLSRGRPALQVEGALAGLEEMSGLFRVAGVLPVDPKEDVAQAQTSRLGGRSLKDVPYRGTIPDGAYGGLVGSVEERRGEVGSLKEEDPEGVDDNAGVVLLPARG